ncbi:protein TRANSPARENT TESTA GLABRA 1-like [Castanea sativa]|uniref:protein TRANSPARENT TESTA GLABRA 1-like n=1 Tax=Castanea sativa TaxID=21020 RepID=UPI003F64F3F1
MENSTQESQHQHQQNSITHEAPYALYSLAISPSPTWSHHYRIAVASFIETYNNRVDILSFNPETLSLKPLHPSLSFDHPYLPTKLMFHPIATSSSSSPSNSNPNPNPNPNLNLLASFGDFIRLWDLRNHSIKPLYMLNNNKTSEFYVPLTQLIAHDKEVYDIA